MSGNVKHSMHNFDHGAYITALCFLRQGLGLITGKQQKERVMGRGGGRHAAHLVNKAH